MVLNVVAVTFILSDRQRLIVSLHCIPLSILPLILNLCLLLRDLSTRFGQCYKIFKGQSRSRRGRE